MQVLGDLYVIRYGLPMWSRTKARAETTRSCCRVSGHLITQSVLGSVIFGVQQLGARLVVVLGHSR